MQKDKDEVNIFMLSILLIGVFPALGAIFYVGSLTFMRVDTVFDMAFISGASVFIGHLPFLKKLKRYLGEIIGYTVIGWGLIITASVMGCNFLIHNKPVTDIYPIESAIAHPEDRELPYPVSITLGNQNSGSVHVPVADYKYFPGMLRFRGTEEQKFVGSPKIAIMTTAMGIFGYRVMLSKELQ